MHRIYRGALVQETRFWCTKWTKRCRWYRKSTSGVPTRTRHQFRASGRKLWQNSRCRSWFTSINLRCGIVVSDPNNYYSGWKNGGYTPGETSLIGVGCGKPLFFTRFISPGSSATHCLIWQRWRLGPLHTDSCAGLSTVRNYLNISVIREMLANSYIVS